MNNEHLLEPVAVRLARWIEGMTCTDLTSEVSQSCIDTVIDTVGLAFAARRTDYVNSLRSAWTQTGPCTLIGFQDCRSVEAAAMINGTAAHGEDFDNTFEGCPVHPGAVIVPAVLAIAEAERRTGMDVLRGIAVGQEVMCRMGLIAGQGMHAAGFHPTAVIGAMAATAGVAATIRAKSRVTANALGIAGSMASGIIEYLADGSWTKRMHAGWAAQSGLRAVNMSRAGFKGPATVFEGVHGFFRAFAPSVSPDFSVLITDLGKRWAATRIAFKPFACGTMAQPFVDCAIRLARLGIRGDQITELQCSVGGGTVHRLWEPLELKRKPPTAYAAKFSTPYCIAISFLHGDAGLAEFSDELIKDPEVIALANRVTYTVDPDDEYPSNYTGQIRAILTNGKKIKERQAHLRGGGREPLQRSELIAKCAANLRYGGADPALAEVIARRADGWDGSTDMLDLKMP